MGATNALQDIIVTHDSERSETLIINDFWSVQKNPPS